VGISAFLSCHHFFFVTLDTASFFLLENAGFCLWGFMACGATLFLCMRLGVGSWFIVCPFLLIDSFLLFPLDICVLYATTHSVLIYELMAELLYPVAPFLLGSLNTLSFSTGSEHLFFLDVLSIFLLFFFSFFRLFRC
jgi:hypothetical protein